MGRSRRAVVGFAAAALAATAASRARAEDPVILRTFGEPADPAYGPVAWGGDLDGDGHPDLLAEVNYDAVRAYSGATGEAIRTYAGTDHPDHPGLFGRAATFLPDRTDDGVPEILLSAPGFGDSRLPPGVVFILDGATGAEILRGTGTSARSSFGEQAVVLGDVTGDGIPDFAGSGGGPTNAFPGEVRAFSGADGSVIPHLSRLGTGTDNLGQSMVAVGDVNGDGAGDFVVGAPGAFPVQGGLPFGRIELVSGATGAVLKSKKGKLPYLGHTMVALGDVNRDGVMDVAVAGQLFTEIGFYSGANLARLGGIPRPSSKGTFVPVATVGPGADVDGDGVRDLVTHVNANVYETVSVWSVGAPLRGPLFSFDVVGLDLVEGGRTLPDQDGDGLGDLLISNYDGRTRIVRVLPTLPSKFTFAVPLTRPQSQTVLTARGTFTVRVAGGTTTIVVSASGIAVGAQYDVFVEDAPQVGTFTGIGTFTLGPKGGALQVAGTAALPPSLGVSTLADLAGRIVQIRDGSGAVVVEALLPFPVARPAVKLKTPLVRDPASPFPKAAAAAVLQYKPASGATKFSVSVKGVPKGTPLSLRIEDAPGSGAFVDLGAFVGAKFVRDTAKGDALPLGAASAAALSGRAVQVVSAATLVLSGTLP